MRESLAGIGLLPFVVVVCGVFLIPFSGLGQDEDQKNQATGRSPDTQLSKQTPEATLQVRNVSTGKASMLTVPLDSIDSLHVFILDHYQTQGYFQAQIETIDTSYTPQGLHLNAKVRPGERFRVGAIRWSGLIRFSEEELLSQMQTRIGGPFRPKRLERDLKRLVAFYKSNGYHFVELSVEDVQALESSELAVYIAVREIDEVRIQSVRLVGGKRTDTAYVADVLGVSPGTVLRSFDAREMRNKLRSTGLFTRVEDPRLRFTETKTAVIEIPVREADPGHFDVDFGYKGARKGKPGITGRGFIELTNLLGQGRSGQFRFRRLPSFTSSVQAAVTDPYFLGSNVYLEARFEGYQRDSTYGTRDVNIQTGYQLQRGLRVSLVGRHRTTRPGTGAQSPDLIRSAGWYGGVVIRIDRIREPVNPRDGWMTLLRLEEGIRIPEGAGKSHGQRKLQGILRGFLPLGETGTLMIEGNGRILRSDDHVRSDLFRIGGTNSFRGYREEQFLASAVLRGTVEYRRIVGERSYGYAFVDAGPVVRPTLSTGPRATNFRFGYGIGIQYETNLGLLSLSYALNPTDHVVSGKIHLGVRMDL